MWSKKKKKKKSNENFTKLQDNTSGNGDFVLNIWEKYGANENLIEKLH